MAQDVIRPSATKHQCITNAQMQQWKDANDQQKLNEAVKSAKLLHSLQKSLDAILGEAIARF